MVFERDRIKRKGPGRYQLRLRPTERMLVGELVGSLREQLLASVRSLRAAFNRANSQGDNA